MLDLLFVAAGFLGLLLGGNLLVAGAVSLARAFGISPMVIGLTLVGFGTSAPELVTSIQAALAGSPGIAVGNVVGSNIANIFLILGTAAALAPIAVASASLKRDGGVLALATLLCVAVVLFGRIGPLTGMAFVLVLAVYVVATIMLERKNAAPNGVYAAEAAALPEIPAPVWKLVLSVVAGLFVTILGARAVVHGAVSLAANLGVSEAVIGLTIVAVGTSLPELATSVLAARKGQADVAFGNIIGSNIFNILGILGATALFGALPIPQSIAGFDIWVMAGATLLLVVFARTGWRIGRLEGAVLLAGYLGYLAALLAFFDLTAPA